jgi:hypothetical protein
VLAPEPVAAAARSGKAVPGKCMICLGEGAVLDVTQCGHIACPSCLTAFYTQRDLAIYPLRCFACPKRIGIAELVRHSVLTSADAGRAHKFNQLAKFRDSMHKYTSVECLRCHTSNKVRKDLHVHTLRCRDCKCRIDTTLAAAVCPYCSRHTSVKKGITKNIHCQYCSGVFDHSGGKIDPRSCNLSDGARSLLGCWLLNSSYCIQTLIPEVVMTDVSHDFGVWPF